MDSEPRATQDAFEESELSKSDVVITYAARPGTDHSDHPVPGTPDTLGSGVSLGSPREEPQKAEDIPECVALQGLQEATCLLVTSRLGTNGRFPFQPLEQPEASPPSPPLNTASPITAILPPGRRRGASLQIQAENGFVQSTASRAARKSSGPLSPLRQPTSVTGRTWERPPLKGLDEKSSATLSTHNVNNKTGSPPGVPVPGLSGAGAADLLPKPGLRRGNSLQIPMESAVPKRAQHSRRRASSKPEAMGKSIGTGLAETAVSSQELSDIDAMRTTPEEYSLDSHAFRRPSDIVNDAKATGMITGPGVAISTMEELRTMLSRSVNAFASVAPSPGAQSVYGHLCAGPLAMLLVPLKGASFEVTQENIKTLRLYLDASDTPPTKTVCAFALRKPRRNKTISLI